MGMSAGAWPSAPGAPLGQRGMGVGCSAWGAACALKANKINASIESFDVIGRRFSPWIPHRVRGGWSSKCPGDSSLRESSHPLLTRFE